MHFPAFTRTPARSRNPSARRRCLMHALSSCLAAMTMMMAGGAAAAEQAYPNKPVTIIVGFPPGTATDAVARMLSEQLTQRMGQQFIVDNRPGAGGSIGAAMGARAKPDGYTLMIGASAPQAINPHVYSNLTYDARKDFAPIGMLVWLPYLLVVSPDNPARDLTQYLAQAKAAPGTVTYATTGVGTTSHLIMSVLMAKSGTTMTHIPYKGSSQVQTDIIGGRVTSTFDTMMSTLAMVKSNRLRAIAVSTPARSKLFPDVPTVAEQGYPGFDMGAWLGLIAPAGIDAAIQNRLAREVNATLQDPAIRQKLTELGAEVRTTNTPAEFGAFMAADYDAWGKIVKAFNVKPSE